MAIYIYQLLNGYKENAEPFSRYSAFSDVPAPTPEDARNWLMAVHAKREHQLPQYLSQIPRALWSDGLLEFAVKYDPKALNLISPADTGIYQSLCVQAYAEDFEAAGQFHETFRTSETVLLMLEAKGDFYESYKRFPWIESVMTPSVFKKATRNSFEFLLSRPVSEISVPTLNIWFGVGTGHYQRARKDGRLDLPATLLKLGFWPRIFKVLETDVHGDLVNIEAEERPDTLKRGLELVVETSDYSLCGVYIAYVKTFPIAEVIQQVDNRKYVPFIIEMYKDEELRPYINTNRHLKAGLLESALGL